jgi:RluA family pseudouridine synthase
VGEYLSVSPERAGLELDEFLCLHYPGVPKGWWRRQICAGQVLVDGQVIVPSLHLRAEQVVIIDVDLDELPDEPAAPSAEVELLHEDDRVAVVNKPAGLSVEPERWARALPTLSGALLLHARRRAEEAPPVDGAEVSFRPRLVHRIDKDTTGCVVVAKDLDAERSLRGAFEAGTVDKEYLALVEGEHPLADGEQATIDRPLDSDERRSGRVRTVERGGKEARTRVRVEERFRGYTLLRCAPETGRTHQIRVHLASEGYPLAIDRLYGRQDAFYLSAVKAGYRKKPGRPERPLMDRLSLHAARVRFPHPDGGTVDVTASLPGDFERLLRQLRKVRPPQRAGRWDR